MTTTIATVDGIDIEVGDVQAFSGPTYRIDHIIPARRVDRAMVGDDARFAYAGGWSITVVAGQDYRILPRPAAAAA